MRGKSQLRDSISFSLTFSAATALMLLLGAVPAWTQNPVPPTARGAATLPTYAGKLHPVTRPAVNKPRTAGGGLGNRQSLSSSKRPPRADDPNVIYDNGPVNGTTDAWTINFGYIVSDTFVPSSSPVSGFDLYVWEFPGDSMTSLQWSITSGPNSGTVYGSGTVSGANLTDQFISTNQFGYDIDKISATGLNVSLTSGQTYWINLQNASVPSGDPVFWDENSGVGCQSPGCPSQAYESSVGTIASEAFDITGNCNFCPPPPCFESGGNMEIIHKFSGQGDGSDPTGVVADAAGNVYGSSSGGDTGFGLVYQLASKGQGWVFNTLYNFAGGSGGSSPGTPIVGPQGTLYGTANGGIQNCGQNNTDYCGLIYNLRPAPTPCATSSCPWTESVVYQPTGNNDADDPGNLVFDEAGNLYGTSLSGGAYGQGAVFELTPSNGGWTETILYNFTGGSDGASPGSLTLGGDGNLYGTGGGGNAYPYGMVFQLVRPPAGSGWTENVIYSFTGQQDGQWPGGLVQGGLGSLVGISIVGDIGVNVFLLSPSQGSWEFSVIDAVYSDAVQNSLLAWYRGDVYFADGYCVGVECNERGGGVGVLRLPSKGFSGLWSTADEFFPSGQLGVDANRNVYGVTPLPVGFSCPATVWKVSP